MKRFLFALLVAALCVGATIGCAKEDIIKSDHSTQMTQPVKPDSKFPKEPSLLSASHGEATVYAWQGTYSWDVKNLVGGTSTGIESDSPHPLDCLDSIPVLAISDNGKIVLTFEAEPSKIQVRRYKSGGKDYDKYDTIEVKGSSFEAERGNYLYEVIAVWEDSLLRSYCGTAHYAFRTET